MRLTGGSEEEQTDAEHGTQMHERCEGLCFGAQQLCT